MPFNPDIYRSYDIRGVVPDQFTADEAYHIGRAYAQYTESAGKTVVVARDMRPTGDEIEPELVRGLTEGGVNVVRIGQATTPMFYFAVHHLKADGGLNVTASHNPGQYNGIKMTRAEAVPIAADTGLHDIRDLVEQRSWDDVGTQGEVVENDIRDAYIDMVCKDADGVAKGLTIVVDAGNGMAGILLPEVFRRLGGKAIDLYWEPDGTFPNHEANPIIEDNMRDAQAAIAKHSADLGIAFDGDGDRVFFIDETGQTIAGDIATALLAQELLKEHPESTILYDLRSSRATREVIEEAGGTAEMTRVGHSFIKAAMREKQALFAGEVSGHFYFTPWYAESGMLAMMTLLKLLKASGKSLSELVAPIRDRYATSPELNFEVEDKAAAMQRIEDTFTAQADEIAHLDGLTVRCPEWWTNVRPSGTEPLLRMKVEATSQELMEQKRAELKEIIGGTPAES